MNPQLLPWIVAAVVAVVAPALTYVVLRGSRRSQPPLPKEWALAGRAVFTSDERRIYRLLREALPHHIILSKLPLVRFCQPTDATKVRYWYDLLGSTHVTFAVCSANGRVLAAIDLDSERGHSKRQLKVKQSVLDVCRVRYLVCPADHLPSIAELQMIVPQSGAAGARSPLPSPTIHQARDTLANTVAHRRAERSSKGGPDSVLFQDSFFAMDSRLDSQFISSDFNTFSDRADTPSVGQRSGGFGGRDIAGVVDEDEDPRVATRRR